MFCKSDRVLDHLSGVALKRKVGLSSGQMLPMHVVIHRQV